MSHSFTPQIIQERFESLPQDIQAVLTNQEATQRLQNIGLKHKLRMDKIGVLIEYTTLVSLGLVKTEEFINQLQKQLEISRETAEQVAVDVDHDFFDRMRDSLRQAQYQSTSNKRFGERDDNDLSYENDGYGSEPVRDSLINDIEADANGSSNDLSMSSSDYDASDFNKASEYQAPTTSEIQGINVAGVITGDLDKSYAESNLDPLVSDERDVYDRIAKERQSNAQNNNGTGNNVQGLSPSFQEDYQPSTATQASINETLDDQKIVKPVVPGYQAPQTQSIPTSPTDNSPITNFKERLRSQIDSGSHTVNTDPYKESI